MNYKPKSTISLPAAIAIGVGGMIGAGIFSILGIVSTIAGSAIWISFLIGGIISLFCAYSYAKLGVRFPSAGGPVEFLLQGWGRGTISASLNLFMWIGYIIAIALYAQGFAAYFLTFFNAAPSAFITHAVAAGIVLLFTIVNLLGAGTVGKAELYIVIVKVSILLLFAVIGLYFVKPEYLSTVHWQNNQDILFATGVLFIGYEGFGLITNAAGNMLTPRITLPRALYASVVIVILIYLLVSIALVGNLTNAEIAATKDYALAEAAKPFFGTLGFKLIAIAALLSTASAINATLFGGANICAMMATDRELPSELTTLSNEHANTGLFITTVLTLIFIFFFDLASIAMMGSGAFLLIYTAVNLGHLRIANQTQANRTLLTLSVILCFMMFIILEVYTYHQAKAAVYTMVLLLVGCYIFESIRYRK